MDLPDRWNTRGRGPPFQPSARANGSSGWKHGSLVASFLELVALPRSAPAEKIKPAPAAASERERERKRWMSAFERDARLWPIYAKLIWLLVSRYWITFVKLRELGWETRTVGSNVRFKRFFEKYCFLRDFYCWHFSGATFEVTIVRNTLLKFYK